VLPNLVNNAREAVARGGEITVRTEADGSPSGGARLVVGDTGPGIPAEAAGRLFEPFFTTKAVGSGLGLAVCYGIVRDHDGRIDVVSRPGEGTTFLVSLPGSRPRETPRDTRAMDAAIEP
jgi:two-component system NtrC family sensor kinase